MIEVIYDNATREVRGWCGDPREFGIWQPTETESVVIIDNPIPPWRQGGYKINTSKTKLINSDHLA